MCDIFRTLIFEDFPKPVVNWVKKFVQEKKAHELYQLHCWAVENKRQLPFETLSSATQDTLLCYVLQNNKDASIISAIIEACPSACSISCNGMLPIQLMTQGGSTFSMSLVASCAVATSHVFLCDTSLGLAGTLSHFTLHSNR